MLNQIPRGANIIVAGHSLGGMDGENLIANSAIQFYYHPVELITYGSPITQPPVAGVKYVRYSSPNDIVRLTALGSWISNPSQWIYVNNPGQNPELAPFFQPGSNPQQMVQTVVGGLMAAHLKYTVSPDLAQYSALGGDEIQRNRGAARCHRRQLLRRPQHPCNDAHFSKVGVGLALPFCVLRP